MSDEFPPIFSTFIAQLRRDLACPLPGRDAQYRMAPRPRQGGEISDTPGPTVRRGGVLVLFYPVNLPQSDTQSLPTLPLPTPQITLPLILRQTYDGVHSGQVGFPGGGQEETDADLIATALREAEEEVGVRPDMVEISGSLTPLYVNASNYLVQPIVGWTATRPTFQTDSREVAKLIETPLADLLDERNLHHEKWRFREKMVDVPFFKIQEQMIWGATAMMLSELLMLPSIQTLTNCQ